MADYWEVFSYVVLFVFCFSTGKAILAINKGLQRSVFVLLLHSMFFAFTLPIICSLIRLFVKTLKNPFHLLSHSDSSYYSHLHSQLSTFSLYSFQKIAAFLKMYKRGTLVTTFSRQNVIQDGKKLTYLFFYVHRSNFIWVEFHRVVTGLGNRQMICNFSLRKRLKFRKNTQKKL